jgi:hypothetical protein
MIDAYTVAHEAGEPRYATAVAHTPAGARVVVRTDDPVLAASMTTEEWCGREIAVEGDRFSAGA